MYVQIVFCFEKCPPGYILPKQNTRYEGIKKRNNKVYSELLVITESLDGLT